MLTTFGKELRKIRVDKGEILKDMAEKLNVTPAFLSAVETGKKNIPDGWIQIISNSYNLSREAKQGLKAAAETAVVSVKINLVNSTEAKREAAFVFARDFSSISDEDAQKISRILRR